MALRHLREFKPRMDANQRECILEQPIRVYLRPFAVGNGTSGSVFACGDFL